jgi:hypothetical protein
MINLQPYVDKVWEATTIEEKRKHCLDMIEASTATKKTKVLTTIQVNKASLTKLDSLAVNYSFSGMGLKVV